MKIEDLNLYALKYFFDVVETKSLTKAAEINFVTRPAISQAIVRLEDWAGKQLTTHQKKTFELTPAGEDFYRHMKSTYLSFKKNLERPQIKRSLKVGCSSSVAEAFLIPKLKKMKTIDSLHLITGTTKQLSHSLSEEEIHIALSVKEKKEAGDEIIHRGEFVLASPNGKSKEQIIVTETRPEVAELKRYFLKQKVEINFLSVESWSLALKLATELNCACLIPDFLLGKELKKISLKNFHPVYAVVAESVEREKLSVAESELIELILK